MKKEELIPIEDILETLIAYFDDSNEFFKSLLEQCKVKRLTDTQIKSLRKPYYIATAKNLCAGKISQNFEKTHFEMNTVLDFGIFKGKTFEQIAKYHRKYLKVLARNSNNTFSKDAAMCIRYFNAVPPKEKKKYSFA